MPDELKHWDKNEEYLNPESLEAAIFTAVLTVAELAGSPVAFAQDSPTAETAHYFAVASDRHNSPNAIGIAMNGMPASVELNKNGCASVGKQSCKARRAPCGANENAFRQL